MRTRMGTEKKTNIKDKNGNENENALQYILPILIDLIIFKMIIQMHKI